MTVRNLLDDYGFLNDKKTKVMSVIMEKEGRDINFAVEGLWDDQGFLELYCADLKPINFKKLLDTAMRMDDMDSEIYAHIGDDYYTVSVAKVKPNTIHFKAGKKVDL